MNINFDTEVFKKILDVFSGMSPVRTIVMTICLVIMLMVYLSAGSWTTYIDTRLNKQESTSFNTAVYDLPKDKRVSAESVLESYIKRYKDELAMVLVYKFVPEDEAFFQSRVEVAHAINTDTNLKIEKYNLKILHFGALRAQLDEIMANRVFSSDISKIINEYTLNGNPNRDKYLSPINFPSLYNDGAKYMISIPVQNYRPIGYVSVYFKNVPATPEQLERYLNIARSIAGEAGYYIAY